MSGPLVSCVMPTFDRRAFVPRAIRYFQRQDHPDRELLVVDDGTDPVEDLVPADPRIRYLRLAKRHTIGAKRTIGVHEAAGEIIVHWDDDDWMAPARVSRQVAGLLAQDVDVSGLNRMSYLDIRSRRCWRYTYPRRLRPWIAEPTFCYRREVGIRTPFPDQDLAAGTTWLWADKDVRIGALADPSFYVGIIHAANTALKDTSNGWWRPVPQQEIATLLGADWPEPPADLGQEPTTSPNRDRKADR
jgi:glycosyltransferase involved in cell wall biosynthesis